jgi:hypothetical protein
MKRRQFPSAVRRRAEELGPVELMTLLEFRLKDRPRSLRNVRREYSNFCLSLYQRLERTEPAR